MLKPQKTSHIGGSDAKKERRSILLLNTGCEFLLVRRPVLWVCGCGMCWPQSSSPGWDQLSIIEIMVGAFVVSGTSIHSPPQPSAHRNWRLVMINNLVQGKTQDEVSWCTPITCCHRMTGCLWWKAWSLMKEWSGESWLLCGVLLRRTAEQQWAMRVRGTKNGRRGGRRIMDNEYEREAPPVVQVIESQQAVILVLN